ncbi:MAG: ABC transporter substrate-binding protein [Bowdeniella nasicola]|nr:ABC transporter substrate-binding protein [Bowdeniella nasicola]
MTWKTPLILAATAAVSLTGCSDPNLADSPAGDDSTITIGSAAFPESEIIAEIYAQALEQHGFAVERLMQIGSREVYARALESGEIDLIPEYSGNLLSFYQPESQARGADEIITALDTALPEGTEILQPAAAEDKDSLTITRELSEAKGITSIADLAKLDAIIVAANPEFSERSYGVPGLESIYQLTNITHVPIDDGGGPATVKALLDGDVNVANIYSTTPAIVDNNLVTLTDPEEMIAAQQVVPYLRSEVASDEVVAILNDISAKLTTEGLVEMNARSAGDEKAAPATIAADWLKHYLPAS